MGQGKHKSRVGVVTSNKMQKTVVVEVERSFRHPKYGKVIRMSNKFKAHDENNQCAIGDQVLIIETRPISRDKCWRVAKILGKGKVRAHELPAEKENNVDSES